VRGARISAVAPDIETSAEGTHLNGPRAAQYLHALRVLLPRDVSILPTVPWPSADRIRRYPYSVVAHFADGLIPMAYWYTNSSYVVTRRSILYLQKFHRPVMPLGQGYDQRIDLPSLPPSHPAAELAGFMLAARRLHVQAVSLWVWQTAGPAQWSALSRARHTFVQ